LPLVGFVVGKKAHNRAVKRNLVKRRVREAYRLMKEASREKLNQWYSMVWVMHDKAINVSYEEIVETVRNLIDQADRKYGKSKKAILNTSPDAKSNLADDESK
jgi:ribonuclease P protein component